MKAKYVVLALGLAGLAGCSSDPNGPALCTLVVETEATGANIPEFSTLTIEGLAPIQISTEDGLETTQPIPVGDRDVSLDVPGTNCTTADNPRTVNVREGEVNITTFVTTCS
jgi:hypothetical protein